MRALESKMAESIKARLSSRVVIPESNRRDRRERNRSPDRRSNRRNNRDYQQHDDRTTSPDRRINNDRNYENIPRRNRVHANDNLAVKERLGFVRGNERPAKVIEVNADPRDVPRGKRYFEHDDRESDYGNRNYNNTNRSRSFQRQRSRSPIWRNDRFNNDDRRNRAQRQRPSWQQQRNDRSSLWKHDKFEELETEEKKGSKEEYDEENNI